MNKFTQKELQNIVWDELPDGWIFVSDTEIEDQDRWHVYKSKVISDGSKYFYIGWGEGATEYQEWEGDIECYQVWPKEITKTIYVVNPDT